MLSPGSDLDSDRIFSPFDLTRQGAVVAAVSGGSDSLAMLLLLQRRLERVSPRSELVAVTVDHRLRAEAGAEAEAVGRFCAERGIRHLILRWMGEKPISGMAEAARLARYRLLADAAASAAAELVVTGHTADDQAETVAMRQERGDGRGLAGMAPATLFAGRTWIVRPLLGVRRETLRAFLRGEGIAWIDDPSNRDMAFERPRTRRRLAAGGGSEGRVEALLQLAAGAGAARQALGVRAADLIARHAERPMPGLVRLAPAFAGGEEEAALLALRALLAVTGGTEQLPDAERSAALMRRLREEPVRATLSRCVVDRRKTGIFLHRERRALPEGPPTAGTVWDGRYQILAGSNFEGATGATEARAEAPAAAPDVPAGVGRAVRATMPQLAGSQLTAVPVLAPWRRFLPSFDLVLAGAVARLVGAADIPSPPFAGHNGKEA